jgi:hypothetical protein
MTEICECGQAKELHNNPKFYEETGFPEIRQEICENCGELKEKHGLVQLRCPFEPYRSEGKKFKAKTTDCYHTWGRYWICSKCGKKTTDKKDYANKSLNSLESLYNNPQEKLSAMGDEISPKHLNTGEQIVQNADTSCSDKESCANPEDIKAGLLAKAKEDLADYAYKKAKNHEEFKMIMKAGSDNKVNTNK